MTKKHYQAIAEIIKSAIEYQKEGRISEPIRFIADNIAQYMANDNPLFSMDKFFTACGLK